MLGEDGERQVSQGIVQGVCGGKTKKKTLLDVHDDFKTMGRCYLATGLGEARAKFKWKSGLI